MSGADRAFDFLVRPGGDPPIMEDLLNSLTADLEVSEWIRGI